MLNKIKNLILKIKSIFIKPKLQPMGSTIIPNATIIKTDDETNPLDVDLLKGNIKNTKKLRQYTKSLVTVLTTFACMWITLSYILSAYALIKYQISQPLSDLSQQVCITILGVVISYCLKAFIETYCEKKNEIELNNENNNQIINSSNDDYSTVTNDNIDNADTDDNDSVG
jgi:hypothetical protein